ncbi:MULTISPECIES: universal stress protein [Christiangramia]|uniref:UspA n=1 Tax=Christiangramia flava JLT2011 TaxID=1229726 RepID=A0A1L7IA76_9FLAO|nr:universal stress protein [Christiangramia flava]APU70144.1 UspA [Christiangramia flava JLT2011]OSS39631.1 universal stress protein family protein [Christiangramia flava JLT2011]
MKLTKILIPIDFSQAAATAISYALMLARKLNVEMIIAHAYTAPIPSNGFVGVGTMTYSVPDNFPSYEEYYRNKIKEFLENYPEFQTENYKLIMGVGAIENFICQTAKDENVDMILMGTEGIDSSIEEFFMGTLSEKVSRNAPCPVLVIPETIESYNIKNIGLALDKDNFFEISFKPDFFAKLLKTLDASISLIHFSENDEKEINEKEVNEYYSKILNTEIVAFHCFNDADPQEKISKFYWQNSIDVLTLIYRDHGFFEKLLNKGFRKELVFHSNLPLLILK